MSRFETKLIFDDVVYLKRNDISLECPHKNEVCSSRCPLFELRERKMNGGYEQVVTLHCSERVIHFRDNTTSYKKGEYNAKGM